MKKTIRTIITLAIIATIALDTVTLASAYTIDAKGRGDATDDGYVTLDTVIYNNNLEGYLTVGDLFWTGTIGSAESSGTLNNCTLDGVPMANVTWTLKDGVLILKGDPNYDGLSLSLCDVGLCSPFWNNEHIETIVIGDNVQNIGLSGTFQYGLPKLKTVIMPGNTEFSTLNTLAVGGNRSIYSTFPTDHEVYYVCENSGICTDNSFDFKRQMTVGNSCDALTVATNT